MPLAFALNPAIDAVALARRFAQNGHARIHGFLEAACASALHRELQAREDWKQVINSADKLFELDRAIRRDFSAERHAALDSAVYAGAQDGFQFRYETLRVPDGRAQRATSADSLARFAQWMSGDPVRTLLRTITADDTIAFADAQATAYSPGDFLTGHDDAVEGKQRHAAYVLGLSPKWRLEWGGLLALHDGEDAGRILVPGFNTLDLIRVGQLHSVSEVTRAATARRYAVTGWLRTCAQPA